ncbi:ABC transporter ATP-binding protein [Kaustia mangrovi]|uniref:ABC transporter ATP-binding protein n=1 Tax=Kaustia mangrovi TaxID=2593653 RepID=UPI001BCB4FB9|nr:ABC transporter ATP-binding protein [Kaustia mangrovi]
MTTDTTVLDIHDLGIDLPTFQGDVAALNGVSLAVKAGEIVGLVGESGSGKSVTAMMAMRLIEEKAYRVRSGRIAILGRDVLAMSERELSRMRARDAAMIFQEPMTALNPTRRIGDQMCEVIRQHRDIDRAGAKRLAADLLREVQLGDAEQTLGKYPFELSGGMRQRVLIAMAYSCNPKLIIADEPTTALDVTVQKQILLLLRRMAEKTGSGVLLITHDLAVVSQICHRVYVLYAGSVMETGATRDIIHAPRHPYTSALLKALPDQGTPREPLPSIPGTVPDPRALPAGCLFANRCERRLARCDERPPLFKSGTREVACWLEARESEESER